MPSKKQQFPFPELREQQLLIFAYGTFLELGWPTKFAVPGAIVGHTPKSVSKNEDEIVVAASDGLLTITSNLFHGETFDMLSKNTKHINDFIIAFENVRSKEPKQEWTNQLFTLMKQTEERVTVMQNQDEEINEVMHFDKSNLYATYAIIAMNVIVFILMAINGAGIFEADGYSQIKWGSNYTPLTLSGDWWRLITSVFIHFGIFHLAMNSYAFYMAGIYLEPMLGKVKFIVAYLCTGVFASLASLWWHYEGVNSAGASGAIFGMYGVFLALLLTSLIPKQIRGSLLTSIGVFVVFNLAYGTKSGIDNAAHIGGLLSGLIIGFAFYPLLKKSEKGIKNTIAILAIAVVTFFVAKTYLYSPENIISAEERQQELSVLKELTFPGAKEYYEKLSLFADSDSIMVALIKNDDYSYTERITKNEKKMEQEIKNAGVIIEEMKKLDVSEKTKNKIALMDQLLNARKEEFESIKKLAQDDSPGNQLLRSEIREKEQKLLDEINELK